ncbi:hypothetical protein, partial [Leucobacter sp. M11]|uniref:hypothetical protein n=1 Tax=Leucobacter sp. M11 TaxID=2993565 RepID=UPI002D7E35F0
LPGIAVLTLAAFGPAVLPEHTIGHIGGAGGVQYTPTPPILSGTAMAAGVTVLCAAVMGWACRAEPTGIRVTLFAAGTILFEIAVMLFGGLWAGTGESWVAGIVFLAAMLGLGFGALPMLIAPSAARVAEARAADPGPGGP